MSNIDSESIADPKIEELLGEFKEQRDALKEMVIDLEKLRKDIDKLFPDKIDNRFVKMFEEKIKAASSLFGAILDIRREINKGVKDEIEIRRKVESKSIDTDSFIRDSLDLRELAKRVEKQSNNLEEMKKNEE